MKTVKLRIDSGSLASVTGRVDWDRVDATTQADLTRQQAEDDAQAMLDAAKFARRVRMKLGFSQAEFAQRIDVPLDTIRNWEQGKRCPVGCLALTAFTSGLVPHRHCCETPIHRKDKFAPVHVRCTGQWFESTPGLSLPSPRQPAAT